MQRDEIVQILEELARTGPPTARVAAIRVLLKLEGEDDPKETHLTGNDALDELYALHEPSALRKRG